MKHNNLINSLKIAFAVLTVMSFSACEKNTIDPSGSFNLKVVNAAQDVPAQSFTIAGEKIISGGLGFTDASAYIPYSSGKRLVCEFKNESNDILSAKGELWTADGANFTAYLAGQGSSLRVKFFEDDLSVPNGGKVKVKFIHLSDAAPSDLAVKSNGENLVNNLSRNTESSYKYVNPGNLSITVVGNAQGRTIGTFDLTGLVAGKIYTLYLTGSTDATIKLNKVLHN